MLQPRNISPAPSRRRNVRQALTTLTAAAVLSTALACADAPSAPASAEPAATPRLELVSTGVTATVLGRTLPLPYAHKAVAIIGSAGGTFSLPSAGLTVVVPPGAVSAPTTFTVSAPAGTGVWYEFGPHGARFAVPLTIRQDLRGTNVLALLNPRLEAAYFTDGSANYSAGIAKVKEFLPVAFNSTRTELSFRVSHFSGYMVATGRYAF
jgi:hypothetical protein